MALHGGARGRVMMLSALGALLLVSGCGGRAANPVAQDSAFDLRLSCAHIDAESQANLRRIEDLRDERNTNRLRNLTRLPGAIIGNPLSALALADTSRAIYIEIDALEERNTRLEELKAEKSCNGEDGATLVGAVFGGAASFIEAAVTITGEAVDAVGGAADAASDLISGDDAEIDEGAADAGAAEEGAASDPGVAPAAIVEEGAAAPAAVEADVEAEAPAASEQEAAQDAAATPVALAEPAPAQ